MFDLSNYPGLQRIVKLASYNWDIGPRKIQNLRLATPKTREKLLKSLSKFLDYQESPQDQGHPLSEFASASTKPPAREDGEYLRELYLALSPLCLESVCSVGFTTNIDLTRWEKAPEYDSLTFDLLFSHHHSEDTRGTMCEWKETRICVYPRR
jgi:hypothetical protein